MIAAAIVVGTVLSYVLGWLAGIPVLVPVLNTIAGFPFMVSALKRGQLRLAIARVLIWALALGVCATLLAYARPTRAGELFVNGPAYRTEMFVWVATGRGMESTPSRFIPRHAAHAVAVALLASATGGVLAMPTSAAAMNHMGYFAGTLGESSVHPAAAMVLAWPPWSIVRIVSLVVIGVILSAPLLGRVFGFPMDWRAARGLLQGACAGLLIDVILEAMLAPAWQRLLLRLAGW